MKQPTFPEGVPRGIRDMVHTGNGAGLWLYAKDTPAENDRHTPNDIGSNFVHQFSCGSKGSATRGGYPDHRIGVEPHHLDDLAGMKIDCDVDLVALAAQLIR